MQVNTMQDADWLDAVTTDGNVGGVGLAICRRGSSDIEFFFREEDLWVPMTDTSAAANPMDITNDELSIGMFAGTFYSGGQETTGEFDYIGFRTGGDLETDNCPDEVESLDAALSNSRP